LLTYIRFYYLALASVALLGCAIGPDFQPPSSPQVNSYTASPLPEKTIRIRDQDDKTQTFNFGQSLQRQWWTLFECAPLNQLIKQGLLNNPSLQAAQAAVRQAEENLKGGIGGYWPTLDAQGSLSRQKASEASLGQNAPLPTFNLYNASLNVSYSPDIFGTLRRQVESLGAQTDYQRFEWEAAYLTLTTTIVTTAIHEALLRAQIQVTQDLLGAQEKQLKIITSQFRLGGSSQSDILAQETLVAQTKATLPPLTSSLAQGRHNLAILVGDLPSKAVLPIFTFQDIHLPSDLPVTLPTSLVHHRPDIKAVEALLHQASAQIGVAKANMLPQLTLTGTVGDTSNNFHSLFASSSSVWNIGSQLLQPLFRGGAMIAKENAAIAAYDQAFALYRQTVLQAFQQVADVLHALVEDAKTYKALVIAEKAASDSLRLSRKQYKLGALSFLAVLSAERQYQQTRLNRLQAEAARYKDTAALFQALGGDCFRYRDQENPEEANAQERKP